MSLILSGAMFGCGADPDSAFGQSRSELGYPVIGVGDFTGFHEQAESVVSVSTVNSQRIVTTTFNDDTECLLFGCPDYIQYPSASQRRVFPGASLLGWATTYDDGATWTYRGKVTPWSSWPVLWGDPAIARSANNQNYVYITNLAVHSSKVPGSGYMDGYMGNYVSGACVARSTDGGISFAIAQCMTNNYHFYDGSSIVVAGDNRVWAAFNDTVTQKIDVWKADSLTGTFYQVADPFPGYQVDTHPRLATWNNQVYLLAQLPSGQLAMNKANQYGQWGTPVGASEGPGSPRLPVAQGSSVNLSDREVRLGPQYDLDVVGSTSPAGGDNIRIVYTARDPNQGNKMYIDTTMCNLTPTCSSATGMWNTKSVPGDQFHPTVAAYPGFIGSPMKWMGSFWSRSPAPSGNQVSLQYGTLGTMYFYGAHLRVWPTSTAVGPQVPCSTQGGYWGDYHEIKHLGLNGSDATFVIPFSDSSQGCQTRWDYFANHLHVSSTNLQ